MSKNDNMKENKLYVLRIHTKYKYKNKKVFVYIFKNLRKISTSMDLFDVDMPLLDLIKLKKTIVIIDRFDDGSALDFLKFR